MKSLRGRICRLLDPQTDVQSQEASPQALVQEFMVSNVHERRFILNIFRVYAASLLVQLYPNIFFPHPVRGLYTYQASGADELDVEEGEVFELSAGPNGGKDYAEGWWEGTSFSCLLCSPFFKVDMPVSPAPLNRLQ